VWVFRAFTFFVLFAFLIAALRQLATLF
jgi:hypothetical protein